MLISFQCVQKKRGRKKIRATTRRNSPGNDLSIELSQSIISRDAPWATGSKDFCSALLYGGQPFVSAAIEDAGIFQLNHDVKKRRQSAIRFCTASVSCGT